MDLTSKSSLVESYEFMESNKTNKWAETTKRSYRKTVTDVEGFMNELNIDPILENIDLKFVKKWENNLYEIYAEKSINQKIAVMTSLFKYLRDIGVVTLNPFATLTTTNNDQYTSHSRELDIEELYQVYKTAHLLESKGTRVLPPLLVVIFTGFRNVTLTKLKVNNLDFKKSELQFKLKNNESKNTSKKDSDITNKVKELVVPLPPKLMELMSEHTEGLNKDDKLLYGLRGKPLAHKQMNYITKLVCEELGWTGTEEITDAEGKPLPFTPHSFRYSIATFFSEMGVDDQSIRHVLGHSNFDRGNLRFYIKSYNKNVKQIRAAQQLLETLLSTTLEIETKYNLKIDLYQVFETIDIHYQHALLNKDYFNYFKGMLINHALQMISQQMFQAAESQDGNKMTLQQHSINPMHMQQMYNHQNHFVNTPTMLHTNPYMTPYVTNIGPVNSFNPIATRNPYNFF